MSDAVAVPDGSDPAELAAWLLDLARAGETARLIAYVDAGAPVEMASATGDTLLMLASYHGHADLVRELLTRGADPNALNARGQSPVAGAIFKNDPEVIGLLLAAGADLDLGTPTGRESAVMFGVEVPGA